LLDAAGLRREDLILGDLGSLFTAALPFTRRVRPPGARFAGAAALAALRPLVLTASGSAARFSVSSWLALVSAPAA